MKNTENFNNMNDMMDTEPTRAELDMLAKEYDQEVAGQTAEQLLDDLVESKRMSALNLYFKDIDKIPLLSAEQEQKLGVAIKEGGSAGKHAANRLIEANTRLVVYCAKKFVGPGRELEELIGCGNVGLIQAVNNFDYKRGCRFSTYAMHWIRQAIVRGIYKASNCPHIPYSVRLEINRVKNAQKAFEMEHGREASFAELVQLTDLLADEIERAFLAMRTVVSFDDPVSEDDDTTLAEKHGDDNAMDPFEYAVQQERKDIVAEVLDALPDQEGRVIALRNGIGIEKPMTLDQIGSLPEFNLSRERIRQIELRGQRRIRQIPKYRNRLLDAFEGERIAKVRSGR